MVKKEVVIDENNIRLDRYIREKLFKNIPQSLLERYLRTKVITVNNAYVKSNSRTQAGQILSYDSSLSFQNPTQHVKREVKDTDFNCPIIYQDQYIIALNKPCGIAVQGGPKIKLSIDDMLDTFEAVNNERPRIVHRLDKETSGILIVARTLEAARFLTNLFANKKIIKLYRAILHGVLSQESGKVDIPLINTSTYRHKVLANKTGKPAITYFKRLKTVIEKNFSYVELQPITGRKHQLRAHMEYLGLPIIGDTKYGDSTIKTERLLLHAYEMTFTLPNDKKIHIKAPVPNYIASFMT